MYVAVIVCTCAISVTSCSKDPLDKLLDKCDVAFAKIDKLAAKDNPSPKEIQTCINDLKELEPILFEIQLDERLVKTKITPKQLERFLELMKRMQNIAYDPKYQRLGEFASQYNLNY